MRRRGPDNLEERQAPDCCVCIHRKECERFREGSWCTRFQGAEPEKEGEDPNDLWKRGEEVDL